MTEETAWTPRTDALHTSHGWKIGELVDLCKELEISNCKAKAGWQTALSSYDTQLKRANSFEREVAALTGQLKEFDPDPVVCGCHEAGCPHTPIAKLPRQALVDHFKARIKSLTNENAALTTQRDESNAKFENHTKAVAEWTSTVADIIGLGEHGKVTPDQILDQLIYGRQWASDMQTKLTAAEAELDAAKRALAEMENKVLHRDHQVASMITWLENYQPDVFKRGLWDGLPKSPDAVKKPRFEKVYCSQCGGEFGPRDSGYSHCKDHIRDAALAAKSTEQKECKRCGQIMPADSTPDGCKDYDCPEAK